MGIGLLIESEREREREREKEREKERKRERERKGERQRQRERERYYLVVHFESRMDLGVLCACNGLCVLLCGYEFVEFIRFKRS